ncbi:Ldh family oxidoreductase [Paraurantiacibacter namhicola]|uniref:(2R)-3-sulfolactate dehydrogenase (NADP(+)) n=1 Tax=Paraurantiacibacter namhicola TaxID=645517 RepID=A0A1C7D537_9SPHN|nr:Ldh family oxidoreductase [Paraurantiacibacter namhicola]ANU06441.1 (2R)-3-sulfolactate dehydrogenase (NADP(+)) [Paraurantiacibacter namhicola]
MTDVKLALDEVHALVVDTLMRCGCDEENAAAVARVITAAERDGCHSHGLMRLAGYAATLKSGKVNGKARPRVEQIAPAVVRVDGDGGFAPLALETGRQPLVDCARKNGIAALALVDIYHFAALWTEIEPLAEAGLCALACTSYKPAVIPAGGKKALYGTNPIAFGWPRKSGNPVVFDQATSVVARGEVMLAAREGHQMAEGVGVDADGNPTTDPNAILEGSLLAFGGHKGSSLAMMVELLAGGLIGESFSFEAARRDNNDGGPPQGGEFILAMDPGMFGDAEGWLDHSELLFEQIAAQEGTRLPGDRRHANRERNTRDGISLSQAVYDKILEL